MASLIPQEYHLVGVGQWQQQGTDPTLGRLPITYNKLPDGIALPNIRPALPEEVETLLEAPSLLPNPAALDELTLNPSSLPPTLLEIKPDEIGNYVSRLRRSAKEKR